MDVACWSTTGGDAVPAVKGRIACGLFERPSAAARITEPIPAPASRRVPLAASGRVVFVAADMAGLAVFSPLGLLRQLAPTFIGLGCAPVRSVVGVGGTSRFIRSFWAVLAFPVPARRPAPVVPRQHPEGPAGS